MEQDRQERAKSEGEAGGWYYDSEDELRFNVESRHVTEHTN